MSRVGGCLWDLVLEVGVCAPQPRRQVAEGPPATCPGGLPLGTARRVPVSLCSPTSLPNPSCPDDTEQAQTLRVSRCEPEVTRVLQGVGSPSLHPHQPSMAALGPAVGSLPPRSPLPPHPSIPLEAWVQLDSWVLP